MLSGMRESAAAARGRQADRARSHASHVQQPLITHLLPSLDRRLARMDGHAFDSGRPCARPPAPWTTDDRYTPNAFVAKIGRAPRRAARTPAALSRRVPAPARDRQARALRPHGAAR